MADKAFKKRVDAFVDEVWEDVIEDIRARCDIVDVIGAFVQLKRSGADRKSVV